MAVALQDDNVPINRARVVTEWFDEHENYVNQMAVSVTRSQPGTVFSTINKTSNDGISRGRMMLHPSNRVRESMPRFIEAVLPRGTTPY
jgi:hypothetical protein